MGLLSGRQADEQPKLKQFRKAAKGAKLTMDQIAYGTWRAMAADDPRKAAAVNAEVSAMKLGGADKSAVDSILAEIGVSA